MAGGKLSPRQKMINLMYLVFIAMLALNMSKEVLTAFGNINEDLVEANQSLNQKSEFALDGLESKAEDSPEQFEDVYARAQLVDQYSSAYYDYLASIKNDLEESVDDPKDYETMDKGLYLEENMISGGKLTDYGQKFMNKMQEYRKSMLSVLDSIDGSQKYEETIKEKFSGEPIVDSEGVKKSYIEYHFIGFPLISSITKITTMQNRVKRIENELFSQMLSGQLGQIAQIKGNYETLLQTTKGAYYQGETFDGSIVLGRTDKSTMPQDEQLTLDGRKLQRGKDYTIKKGQVKLNVTAGRPGDHKIEGSLIFKQDGKDVPVNVNQSFQVIPKPNQAIVSADKMNVVYRGIDNPMTVSMPGVPKNKIKANVSGNHNWRRVEGTQYMLTPGNGTEVQINVTGEIDGEKYPSKAKFRIKSLPRPTPTVRGQIQQGGAIKLPRNALKVSSIGAKFENFDFDLKPVVKRFTMKIPGQPSVVVNGNTLDAKAQNALELASNGDIIQIFDVKADVPGVNVKNMPALLIQITN
jgi:gliding motility-associated protein GldM